MSKEVDEKAIQKAMVLIAGISLVNEGIRLISNPLDKPTCAREVEDSVDLAAIAIAIYCSTLDEFDGGEIYFKDMLRQKAIDSPVSMRDRMMLNTPKVIERSQQMKFIIDSVKRYVESIAELRAQTEDKNPTLTHYEEGTVEYRLAKSQANLTAITAENYAWFKRYIRLGQYTDPKVDIILTYDTIYNSVV